MSLSAISSAASAALATVKFHLHQKRDHATSDSMTSTSSTSGPLGNTSGVTIGELPVGASTPLFSNILRSLL